MREQLQRKSTLCGAAGAATCSLRVRAARVTGGSLGALGSHCTHLNQRNQRHVRGDATSTCMMQQHERSNALLRPQQRGVLHADGASAGPSYYSATGQAHPQKQRKRAASVRAVRAWHQRIKLGGRRLQQLLLAKDRKPGRRRRFHAVHLGCKAPAHCQWKKKGPRRRLARRAPLRRLLGSRAASTHCCRALPLARPAYGVCVVVYERQLARASSTTRMRSCRTAALAAQ